MTREDLIETIVEATLNEFDPVTLTIGAGLATGWAGRKLLNRYSSTFAKRSARKLQARADAAGRLKKANYLKGKNFWGNEQKRLSAKAATHTARAQQLMNRKKV